MNALRRMTRFTYPYRWVMVAGLATTAIPVTMELLVPRLLQILIDEGIRTMNFNVILWTTMAMLVSALIGALATIGQGFYRARLSQGIAFDLRNGLFTHVQDFSFADLDRMQTGELMTRLSSDVDVVRGFLSAGLALILRAVLMIAGSVVMLTLTDLRLSLVMFVMLVVAAVIIRVVMRMVTPLFTIVQQKLSRLNTIVQENLAGVKVVKAFVREPFEIQHFGVINLAYRDENIRVGRILALVLPLLGIVTNVGIVAVAWWGGMDVIAGRLTVGQLVEINNYLLIGMAPLLLLSNMLMMVSRAAASSVRVYEVLDITPSLAITPTPHTPALVQGQVSFEHVSFRYANYRQNGNLQNGYHTNGNEVAGTQNVELRMQDGHSPNGAANGAAGGDGIHGDSVNSDGINGNGANGDGQPISPLSLAEHEDGVGMFSQLPKKNNGNDDVLLDVNVDVAAGRRVALLGATGSGKSTFVNLIPRFYDVTGGRVCVDGVDVRDWDPHTLRSHIGMVLQETNLFSGTIRDNIAYGRPDASLEEVMAAAQDAQAHNFIMAMPQGYDSQVEERGANLSGGQKQRIAIARALLVKPAILILDDSTSSVDMETEFEIQEAMERLPRRCTTFIVAQRISSVLSADQILILDAGHIVAHGSHQELIQSSPIYRDIYRSQFGERELSA